MLVLLPIFKTCRTFGSTHIKSREEKKKRGKCRLDLKTRHGITCTHTQEKAPAIHLYKTTYYMKLQNTGGKLSFSLLTISLPEMTYATYTLCTELLLVCIPNIL